MRRARRALVDEGEGTGANALASVSDLMTALMIVFLFGAVAASKLAPDGISSPSESDRLWSQSKKDFLQRQLGLRVQAVHHALFSSLALRGADLVGNLAQGNERLDADSTVKKSFAAARALAVAAYDKNWVSTTGPWGCAPGIVPKLTVQGYFQSSRLTEVSKFVNDVKADLDRFIKTYDTHFLVEENLYFSRARTRVDLTISFTLDEATRKALSKRFAAGPTPDGERDRIWCQ